MILLARCLICRHRLGFARSGHLVLADGRVIRWHRRCARYEFPPEEVIAWLL